MGHITITECHTNDDGEVEKYIEKRTRKRRYLNNRRWAIVFLQDIKQFALSKPSRTGYAVFCLLLDMLREEKHGVDLFPDVPDMAKNLNVSESMIYRAIRELIGLNVLCIRKGHPKSYYFSSRIIHYGSLDKYPRDLSMYPEIGKPKELLTCTV